MGAPTSLHEVLVNKSLLSEFGAVDGAVDDQGGAAGLEGY